MSKRGMFRYVLFDEDHKNKFEEKPKTETRVAYK